MPGSEKQGLLKKSALTDSEITEIAQLMQLCNEYEHLNMPISLDALRQRTGNEIDDFIYYEQGVLVGYLFVDSWGKEEKEVTGMVAPALRRRGIFRQLFEAAWQECKGRGVQCLILISEQHAQAGHAFVRSVRAHHDFSEHKMLLGTFVERQQSDPRFHMRPALLEDKEALISIVATDIGDEEDARDFVEQVYRASRQPQYLAMLAGEPLGTLRLDYSDGGVGIYGFVVRPEHRGHGYGRQMLEYIIRQIYREGFQTITLEVETDNHNAIGLYQSCGFQVIATYDYFNRTI